MLTLLLVREILLLESSKLAKSTWHREGGDRQMRQFPARSDQQDKLISKLKQSRFLLAHLNQKVIVQHNKALAKQLSQYGIGQGSSGMTISLADVDQKGPWYGNSSIRLGTLRCPPETRCHGPFLSRIRQINTFIRTYKAFLL